MDRIGSRTVQCCDFEGSQLLIAVSFKGLGLAPPFRPIGHGVKLVKKKTLWKVSAKKHNGTPQMTESTSQP